MAVSYVKFQRGSQAAYDKLVTEKRVDDNTLYFIYPEGNSTVGKLYLGARLISGGDVVLSAASLNDLADVITAEVQVHDFLVAEKVTDAEGKETVAWVNKGVNDVAALIKAAMGEIAAPAKIFRAERTPDHESDEDAIAEQVGEATLTAGDMAIVKTPIAGGKYQHTAYVHNGEAWIAMDGNYDAKNVLIGSNIVLAGDYGKDSRGDTLTRIGNKKIGDSFAAGTSLHSILMDILSQRLQPSATNPSATVVLTNKGSNGGHVIVEVGTSIAPTYKTTFSDGKFTYDEVTGCTSTAATVYLDGVSGVTASIAANALNGATGTLPSYVVNHTSAKYLKTSYGWTASTITPKDNLGDPCTNDAKINASSTNDVKSSSHYIQGFRNYWYGFISTTDTDGATISRITDSTSANYNKVGDGTKWLTAGGAAVASGTLPTITAAAGDRMPVVLVPKGAKAVKSASMPSSLNAPVTFVKSTKTVKLHGLNGFDEAEYDLWYYKSDDMPVGADFSIVLG